MNTAKRNEIILIELDGVLDSQTAADFSSWVKDRLAEGYRAIVLDCSQLQYLSSKGIGAIIEVNRLILDNSGKLALVKLSLEVKRLLEFLKITDDITIFESAEAAYSEMAKYPKVSGLVPRIKPDTKESLHLDSEDELEEKAQAQHTKVSETTVEGFDEAYTPRQSSVEVLPLKEEKIAAAPVSPRKVEEEEEEIILLDDELKPVVNSSEANPGHFAEAPKQPVSVALPKVERFSMEDDLDFVNHDLIASEIAEMTLASAPPPLAMNSPKVEKSSQAETGKTATAIPVSWDPKVIPCPDCQSPLRVSKPGKYLCPSCRSKFRYPIEI